MLKPKYKFSGRPVFMIDLPGGKFATLPLFSYATGYDVYYIYMQ